MCIDEKRERAVLMMQEKAVELDRLPKRSDFSDADACFIKQKLGPWPRALEAAGLKEAKGLSAAEKSRIKRERSKKLRKQSSRAEKEKPSEKKTEE